MTKSVQRHSELEMVEMARKLGVEKELQALLAQDGDAVHAAATEQCENCSCLGECHLFMEGEISATNNKSWWLKGFCPNAKLLLGLAEQRKEPA